MVRIAPSVLAADIEHLEDEIKSVINAGADMIHVDVMDGVFVNNKTPGVEMYERTLDVSNVIIDVHLMVEHPEDWIEKFLLSNIISFHIESVDLETANRIIQKIHEHGIKVGMALKPDTSIETIKSFLDKIDMVLIMTVEPGFGGQKMIENCLNKVKDLKRLAPEMEIEVDGGINIHTMTMVKKSGASILVAGTAIFNSNDRLRTISMLKE